MQIIDIDGPSKNHLAIALDENGKFHSCKEKIINYVLKDKALEGSYALYKNLDNKRIILTRDSLGCHKLFYYYDVEKLKIYVSANFIKLTKLFNKENVFSVPRGGYLEINENGDKIFKNSPNIKYEIFSIDYVEKILRSFFRFMRIDLNRKPLICLSGGLDSSIIAYLAAEEFGAIDVITGVVRSEDFRSSENDEKSDFEVAKKIAKKLGAKFAEIVIEDDINLINLKEIMYYSQDWRDYNVHCAALNYHLAKNARQIFDPNDYFVLTGDFMNEIFADYTSEVYDGEEYYPQPKFSTRVRQRFFMNGLDSSDREVGVFAGFGFSCFQPYSLVANHFRKLADQQLEASDSKYQINGKILPDEIYSMVGRSKVRAQVGDSSGGMLGSFLRAGLTAERLEELFCEYFRVDHKFLKEFIHIGSYRKEKF